ncbi:fluoride efflux transporter CrcB [Falsibacillus pallidus]|uniref:Fluoride-specific ion channel FluC n=1 Tax=Falsibacillus pallidus TaxID=493781 RepID=A0A370GQU0_9BACI|nr:fluoride efflux transporter CrcB [Falsibacillus pallidus]RDI45616.1 camphor resistance protein CrcB [Falsibacillus pallidus]
MVYFVVGAAGILGALCRYYLGIFIGDYWTHTFPLATLITNLVGCFILGGFTAHLFKLKILHPFLLKGIGTGFVGSFTTFSTFSVETVEMIKGSHIGLALLYVILSMWGGLLFAWAGYKIGDKAYLKNQLRAKGGKTI